MMQINVLRDDKILIASVAFSYNETLINVNEIFN